MKKVLKLSVLMILVVSMTLSLVACGTGVTEKAEASVNGMFQAFKALDFEKAQQFVNLNELTFDKDEVSLDVEAKTFMKALFGKLDYAIVSSEKVDNNTVNVVVKITALDMKPILADFMIAAPQYAFSNAFADPQPTEEETAQKMEELLVAAATKDGLTTVTNEVTVKVVNRDNSWKIAPDDAFTNALFGGLKEASDALNESFE